MVPVSRWEGTNPALSDFNLNNLLFLATIVSLNINNYVWWLTYGHDIEGSDESDGHLSGGD